LLSHPVKGPGVGLLGFSKGDEVPLAKVAFLKNIVAGFSPVGTKATNSKFLDYFDVMDDPFQAPGNQSLIPLEKAEAQLLFLVGQDDRVVKSDYATEVCKILQAQGKGNFQILSYPGTGHPVFHKRAILGGEFWAYSKAQVHAWSQIQAFFKKHLIGN
uniref:BAAT/Acyl-CoA thioester hydrolase C-terminal domain-containing protein n=1 Tax=Catharus ustulatus TaxID=91951 RepID=A0A8C3TTA0_CATUS